MSGVASGKHSSPCVQNEKRQLKAVFIVLSGKRDSSPRCAWAISRELYLHPLTPGRGDLGSLVANLVFCSKRSLPYQREVWRDCLYGRGLFRETHKKRIAYAILRALSGKREFNLCSPIILSAKILRFFRFTFEFPSNSFDRFSGTGIAVLCPP